MAGERRRERDFPGRNPVQEQRDILRTRGDGLHAAILAVAVQVVTLGANAVKAGQPGRTEEVAVGAPPPWTQLKGLRPTSCAARWNSGNKATSVG